MSHGMKTQLTSSTTSHGMKTQLATARRQDVQDGIPGRGRTTDALPGRGKTTDDTGCRTISSSDTSMMSHGMKIGMSTTTGISNMKLGLSKPGRLEAGSPSKPHRNLQDRRNHHPHSHHPSRSTQWTPWRELCAKAGHHIKSHESRLRCCWAYLKNPLSKSCVVLDGAPYCSGTLTATLGIRTRKRPCAWWWLRRTCWIRAHEAQAKLFKNIASC